MCLITSLKEKKTAAEDIACYKLLNKGFKDKIRSPFECFVYEMGKLYETDIKRSYAWNAFDSEDAAWLDRVFPGWRESGGARKDLLCFGQGFHSVKVSGRLRNYDTDSIYNSTIPKGAEYYENETGLIVSNKIIINHSMTEKATEQ